LFDVANLLPKVIAIAVLLLVGFPVHEFSHALAAYWQGDAMAKVYGRLTLNPIAHFDRFGSLMVVISVLLGSGMILGWAKPTPINPQNFRDRRNGEVLVALAGPASNLLMAVAFALVLRVMLAAGAALPDWAYYAVYYLVVFNVLLGIFNLLPVPPLDGSNLLYRFLSPRQVWQVRPILQQYGLFILFGIIIVLGGPLSRLIDGVVSVLVGI
jgi:Zn-dependent protease